MTYEEERNKYKHIDKWWLSSEYKSVGGYRRLNAKPVPDYRSPEQKERDRIKALSIYLGDRDLIHISNPEDRYKVAVYRSDQYFRENRKEIEEQTGLVVSSHLGYYGLYTQKEIDKYWKPSREQARKNRIKQEKEEAAKRKKERRKQRRETKPIRSGIKKFFDTDAGIAISFLAIIAVPIFIVGFVIPVVILLLFGVEPLITVMVEVALLFVWGIIHKLRNLDIY